MAIEMLCLRDVRSQNINPVSHICIWPPSPFWLKLKMPVLDALGRLVAPELARGLSTSLALWSSQSCTPCSPTVNCGTPLPCPDCVCGSTGRVYTSTGWSTASVIAIGAVCIVVSFAVGFSLAYRTLGGITSKSSRRLLVDGNQLSAAAKALAARHVKYDPLR